MKWKTVKTDDDRVVKRFLFFPMNIDGESRWLEWVTIHQRYWAAWWRNIAFLRDIVDYDYCPVCGRSFKNPPTPNRNCPFCQNYMGK